MAWRKRLHTGTQMLVERLHLGGEEGRLVIADPVQRRETQYIASDREFVVRAGDGQGERPPQPLECRCTVVFEEHNGRLEVGSRVEAVSARCGANAAMIVDHPVADQADAALGTAGQRLISGLRIDDGQIAAAQPCVVGLPVAASMRATVSESL